ncbi:MAG TPA: hypothetical protein VFK57_19245 [Vicinamibacterales bacterium]|nr:hypothetical protein [Vicinamibacterales bacterium]
MTADFAVTYTDFPRDAEAAFQFAVNIWASRVSSPFTIRVDAAFSALGPGVLAEHGRINAIARPDDRHPLRFPYMLYPSALGTRLDGYPSNSFVDMGPRFNAGVNWYFGTDGVVPPGKYDFVSAALHELAHGLGVFGTAGVNQFGAGFLGWNFDGAAAIYDAFVIDAGGRSFVITSATRSPPRSPAATCSSRARSCAQRTETRPRDSTPRPHSNAAPVMNISTRPPLAWGIRAR